MGEGIGLIEKKNKNCIQWRGAVPGSNTQESVDRLAVLKEENEELDDFEKVLDQHKSWVQQSIKNITEDSTNEKALYVTHEDICQSFEGENFTSNSSSTRNPIRSSYSRTISQSKTKIPDSFEILRRSNLCVTGQQRS